MAITLNSNLSGMQAIRRLGDATRSLTDSLARLSSGSRINNPSDDSAGASVALSLNARSRVFAQASRNANDVISALNVAQGGVEMFSSILVRIKELAEQSANGTLSSTQRAALDKDAFQLTKEYNRILGGTQFNGIDLLSPAFQAIVAQVGFGADGTIRGDTNSALRRAVGNGSFGTSVDTLSGVGLSAGMASGDFNGDGILDIAGSDFFGAGVRAESGSGNGTFSGVRNLTGITVPGAITAADINNDGYDDLIVADGSRLRYFLGSSSGLSTTETSNTNTSASSISKIEITDIDGDGFLDIVAAGGNSTISVVRNSNMSLSQIATVANTNTVADLAIGDINGDGRIDIITTGSSGATGRVFIGNASFGFSSFSTFSITNGEQFAVGDLDNNGFDEIVLSSGTIYSSSTTGALTSSTYSTGASSTTSSIILADLNDDGFLDIYRPVASSEVSFGRGDLSFEQYAANGVVALTNTLLADFNGDGVLDLFSGNSATNTVRLGQSTSTTNLKYFSLASADEARSALESIDAAMLRVRNQMGSLGAAMSRMQSALSVVTMTRDSTLEASSRISDADIAFDSALVTRQSILQQSAAAVLAQANQQPQLALVLLDQ
jgi:flagellin